MGPAPLYLAPPINRVPLRTPFDRATSNLLGHGTVGKSQMLLLRDFLDDECSSVSSCHYSAGRARTKYYRHQHSFRNKALPVGVISKMSANPCGNIATPTGLTWHVTTKSALGSCKYFESCYACANAMPSSILITMLAPQRSLRNGTLVRESICVSTEC